MISKTIELDEVDSEIAAFERLGDEEIHSELDRHGIDPQRTIDSVKSLVTDYLRRRDRFSRQR